MIRTGLDRLLADPARLVGRRYGVLAHGASVTREGVPIHLALAASPAGPPRALFGPEHGYYGIEQDMIAAAGGPTVPCVPYVTWGTQELADLIVGALQDRLACLLANHGMVAVGPNLKKAAWLAVEIEALAAQYWHACQIGEPHVLPDEEILKTNQPIDMQLGAATVRGTGMVANNATQKLHLASRGQIIYPPRARP